MKIYETIMRRFQNPSRDLSLLPAMLSIRSVCGGFGVWRCGKPRPLVSGNFQFLPFSLFSVFRMVRRWLHPKVGIRSSAPYPCSDGASSCLIDLSVFQLTVVSIGDRCCSGTLVLRGLILMNSSVSITTSSTTTSFAFLR
jgi:hypothetical protein